MEIEPVLFVPIAARLSWARGDVELSVGADLAELTANLESNRLERQTSYFDNQGRPTTQMQLFWQQLLGSLTSILETIEGQVLNNQALLAQVKAAQDLASNANEVSNATRQEQSLGDSYVDPANVITAASDGTITIAAHSRVYGDGTSVAVDGATLTGHTPGSSPVIYYRDAAREGGAVAYEAAESNVAQTGDVHVVGAVTIPLAGQVDAQGNVVVPPGYVPGFGLYAGYLP